MNHLKSLYFSVSLITNVWAKTTIDVYDLQGDCKNGKEMIGFDASGLEFIETDEGGVILNGNLSFTKDFNDPTMWKIYSQKLERGTWTPGILSRTVKNICSRLDNQMEPWYPVVSKMARQKCPYEAGHTEHFDEVNAGELGLALTPNFLGEWKLFVEITTQRDDGQTHSECTMVRFRILEV